MAKVKTRVRFAISKAIDTIWNGNTLKQIGSLYVKETQRLVSFGKSPVKGRGRFKRYAVQREDAVSDYPEGIKDTRPVNLQLSGDMIMKHLKFKRNNKRNGVKVGILSNAPKDVRDRAETHNNGNTKLNVPKRQFIPDKAGEEYIVTIERKKRAILAKRFNAIIKKSNK